VARCRECKQREAVPGAGHPLPTPPLCQLDLRHGIIVRALLVWCRRDLLLAT